MGEIIDSVIRKLYFGKRSTRRLQQGILSVDQFSLAISLLFIIIFVDVDYCQFVLLERCFIFMEEYNCAIMFLWITYSESSLLVPGFDKRVLKKVRNITYGDIFVF